MKSPIKSVATARSCLGHFTGKESFWWDGQTPPWGFFSPLAITNIQCLIPQVGDSLCLTEPVHPVRGAAVWGRHLEDNSLLSTGFIFPQKSAACARISWSCWAEAPAPCGTVG